MATPTLGKLVLVQKKTPTLGNGSQELKLSATTTTTTIASMASSQQLPHELIMEILSRIPSKSLARFRCVCKPWSNLTHDLIFTKLRILRTIERNLNGDVVNLLVSRIHQFYKEAILNEVDEERNIISSGRVFKTCYRSQIYYVEGNSFDLGFQLKSPLGIIDFLHDSHVVGSCNGIVCLVNLSTVCLWNPCTAEYKIVRFEKSIEDPILGFGYDASNNDYKLLEFYSTFVSDDVSVSLNIYSLMDITCSTIPNVPYGVPKQPGIFFNGGLHWLANAGGDKIVICFDIEQKKFIEVPMPDCDYRVSVISLGVLGGQLCLLREFYNGYKSTDYEIWVMKNYGRKDSWTKLFVIGDTVMSSTKDMFFYKQYPKLLCFANNGKVLLRDGNCLLLYDPKEKSATNLKIHGITDWSERYSTVLGVEGEENDYLVGPELNGDEVIARLKHHS